MDKETKQKALAALDRQKRTYKRQNEWMAAHYERQSVTLPQGTKDRIKAASGESVNGFINRLVKEELDRLENRQ